MIRTPKPIGRHPLENTVTVTLRSQFTEMILTCEIPHLDIPDVGRNHMLYFFSFQAVKSFQYKRFIQSACLKKVFELHKERVEYETHHFHLCKLMLEGDIL